MAHHGGQTVVSCQMCEQDSQIKMKCLDCDYLLCLKCCQVHKKVMELSDHQIVDLHDIGACKERSITHLNFKNIKCRNHEEEKCCLFCKDCEKVVCSICISERHNQHNMIQMNEGRKLCVNKIATYRTNIKEKVKTLTANMSTLDTIYSTKNCKFESEKDKILGQDNALKEAVDPQTKKLVTDLDQRWDKINKSFKDEMSNAKKYKQRLQSREEQLKQVLESGNAMEVFRTVEEGQKKHDLDERPVNHKYETLPTFKTREINLTLINSLYGSLHDNNKDKKEEIKTTSNVVKNPKKDDFKIHVVESYRTDSISVSSIQCNANGTLWINQIRNNTLKCVEKHEHKTLQTINVLEWNIQNIALTQNGDLLLSVRKSHLLIIPRVQQTITNSLYSVLPLVTTTAIHTNGDKVIVGAKEPGPLYPVNGPRQIIVMNTKGEYEKVFQFDGNNRPLFTNPRKVTSDSNGNLYILDRKFEGLGGRVVTINNSTGKFIVYNGHFKANYQDHQFTPGDLVATTSDNIVVSDRENHLLHILKSNGECVKLINTLELGIKLPWALARDKRGFIYIGCNKEASIKEAFGLDGGAKLHVVKFTAL